MSRNVRQQRPPTTPVKVSRRRGSDASSSLDLSDEGGYSGVDDISDSEDDEEDINAAEEEHILSDELQTVRSSSSPRPHHVNVEESEEADEEQDDEDDEEEEEDYEGDNDDADDNASWDGISSEADADDDLTIDQGYTSTERRVRFDIPDDSSDGDSTETDDDVGHGFFPDLFVDKSILDPSFRREIEHDPDPYDSSNSEAFWDLHGNGSVAEGSIDDDFEALINAMEDEDSTPVATPMTSHELSTAVSTPFGLSEDDEESLDGYQTDGDTTDEEDPPEKPVRRKSRREAADDASDSDGVTLIRPRRGQPRVGRFNLDKSSKKPIAILNPRTGKMMIFTHQCMRGRGFDLSPEQFNFQYFEQAQSSPILSNPGSIMMSGMISSSTYGDFMNTHAVGPAEAWYSQTSDGNVVESSDSDDQVVDEAEKSLRLEDFITLDDDDGESSEDEKDTEQDEADDDIFRTPGRPGTASSDVASLLDHFQHNTNIVGAFRRDQANHQLISRSKATRDSLAFSGPYFEGTLRGIKEGRIATTNIPISPMRKQKRMMPELASSPLSTVSQKRKSSSEHHMGHKRQRSMPDVDVLRI
ncbi:Exoglucanase 1 [Hypoxylon texense]